MTTFGPLLPVPPAAPHPRTGRHRRGGEGEGGDRGRGLRPAHVGQVEAGQVAELPVHTAEDLEPELPEVHPVQAHRHVGGPSQGARVLLRRQEVDGGGVWMSSLRPAPVGNPAWAWTALFL